MILEKLRFAVYKQNIFGSVYEGTSVHVDLGSKLLPDLIMNKFNNTISWIW